MAEVKILIEGYVRVDNGVEYASSAVTLIQENNLNILVDTGMDRELLLKALEKENLSTSDIDFVVLSHTHLDHCLLAGIFEKAQVLDNSTTYSFDGKILKHEAKIPATEIAIIPTPGHDDFHCSVLINTEEFGRVVVAADLFWWPDNTQQKTDRNSLVELNDPYVKDEKKLKESREKILDIADFIIPGHGRPFKITRH